MDNTADLLLINGVIDTLHDEHRHVTSLAVKAGKVLAVGSSAEAAAGPGTDIIDLAGAYVMPGLLDVHNHHMLAGQMDLFELNEAPNKSLDDLLTAIEEYAKKLGPDEWVIGGSWGSGSSPNSTPRKRWPALMPRPADGPPS